MGQFFNPPPLKSSTAIFSGSTPFEPPQVYRTPLESVLSDLWRCFEAKWHFFCYFQAILAYIHCMTDFSGFMRFEHQQVPRNTPVPVLWASCGVLGVKYTVYSMFWAILGCFLAM